MVQSGRGAEYWGAAPRPAPRTGDVVEDLPRYSGKIKPTTPTRLTPFSAPTR